MRPLNTFIAVLLTAVLLLTMPVFAAETAKGTADNPYTLKDIPSEWIKRSVNKENTMITGYTITVPDGKIAVLKLSGTQFKEYRLKSNTTGKYGEAIALNEGKLRTIKDVNTVWVLLRTPVEKKAQGGQKASPTPPNGQKEVNIGDLKPGDKLSGGVIIQDKAPDANW